MPHSKGQPLVAWPGTPPCRRFDALRTTIGLLGPTLVTTVTMSTIMPDLSSCLVLWISLFSKLRANDDDRWHVGENFDTNCAPKMPKDPRTLKWAVQCFDAVLRMTWNPSTTHPKQKSSPLRRSRATESKSNRVLTGRINKGTEMSAVSTGEVGSKTVWLTEIKRVRFVDKGDAQTLTKRWEVDDVNKDQDWLICLVFDTVSSCSFPPPPPDATLLQLWN